VYAKLSARLANDPFQRGARYARRLAGMKLHPMPANEEIASAAL
jgi:hypothetical protein